MMQDFRREFALDQQRPDRIFLFISPRRRKETDDSVPGGVRQCSDSLGNSYEGIGRGENRSGLERNVINLTCRAVRSCSANCSPSSRYSVRSEAEVGGCTRGWRCGARGGSPLPRIGTQKPEREQRSESLLMNTSEFGSRVIGFLILAGSLAAPGARYRVSFFVPRPSASPTARHPSLSGPHPAPTEASQNGHAPNGMPNPAPCS